MLFSYKQIPIKGDETNMKLSLKQAVAVLLSLVYVFCLSACGGGGGKKQDGSGSKSKTVQTSATEISDKDLAPFKELAQKYKLKKDELIDVLSTLMKLCNFQRLRPYVRSGVATDSNVWSIISLPNEVRDEWPIYIDIEKDEKTGRNVLKSVAFGKEKEDKGPLGEGGYLYYPAYGITKPFFNIDDLFITKEKYEKMRKSIEAQYSNVKELKGIPANKIKFEQDIFGVNWLERIILSNLDGSNRKDTGKYKQTSYTRQYRDFTHPIKPIFVYGTVVSYEEEYYGGKDKRYVQIAALFDSNDLSIKSPVQAFDVSSTKDPFGKDVISYRDLTFDYDGNPLNANYVVAVIKNYFNSPVNAPDSNTRTSSANNAASQVSQNSNSSFSSSSNVSYGIINANEVNVRKGPGKNYKSLGVFFKGDKLRLVNEASDAEGGSINWYQIEFDNPQVGLIKGWVRKDFINLAK